MSFRTPCDMIGLVKLGRGRPITAPRPVFVPPGCALTPLGIILEIAEQCAAARDVFEGMEYLRLLAGHRRRVRREEAALQESIQAAIDETPVRTRTQRGALPQGRSWESLRVVNCTCCQTLLLGASDEHLRDGSARRCQRNLPPAIAGRTAEGYALCADCLGGAA